MGLVFALAGWRFGPQPVVLLWCGFAAVLLVLSFIDWDTTVLPDDLTLPLLWSGLVVAAPIIRWTNASAQIAARSGGASTTLRVWPTFWTDRRGRDR